MKSKYIVVSHPSTYWVEEAIIFPESIQHVFIGQMFQYKGYNLVSAGFVSISNIDGAALAYGESVSLKLKHRQEDHKLLDITLGNNYDY